MAVTADDLRAIPLFESRAPHELAELAGWFDARSAGEGVRLTGEGGSGYSFYVLAGGSAVVTVGDDEVAALGPGDWFGELAILGDGRRTATVTTTAPSRLLVMFGTEFRRLEQAYPEIAERVRRRG